MLPCQVLEDMGKRRSEVQKKGQRPESLYSGGMDTCVLVHSRMYTCMAPCISSTNICHLNNTRKPFYSLLRADVYIQLPPHPREQGGDIYCRVSGCGVVGVTGLVRMTYCHLLSHQHPRARRARQPTRRHKYITAPFAWWSRGRVGTFAFLKGGALSVPVSSCASCRCRAARAKNRYKNTSCRCR